MIEIQNQSSASVASATNSISNSVLGKDDFLKLLVMQLRFQDPLNPMKGTEFAAQLAQFSSVEQLANINTNLNNNLDANAILTQSINNALSATFIGKQVRATTDVFQFGGTDPVRVGYSLPSNADNAKITIYDSAGNTVRVINNTGTSKGDNTVTWDGKNDQGNAVKAGQYKFKVEAKDSKGSDMTLTQFVYGKVNGVRFRSDGTVFVIDGAEVTLSSILEIMEE
jgi:flagellar basal-body rod modification protein FlgD